jgi:hypothetical protein
MEVAVGIFAMDMLGITDLFPRLASVAPSRRRLILWLALSGLFFLAAVESSLAILREQIVEADAALKLSLAGGASSVVAAPAHSSIPVVGQAVLGFVLPWILAMMAIPLEMLIESSRHVSAALAALLLQGLGHAMRVLSHAAHSLATAVIAIPLRIERMLRSAPAAPEARRVRDAGVA